MQALSEFIHLECHTFTKINLILNKKTNLIKAFLIKVILNKIIKFQKYKRPIAKHNFKK